MERADKVKRVIALSFLLLIVAACARPDVDQEPVTGGAPDLLLRSVDGTTLNLSDYRGKVILVDFWATWCPPCQRMVPELVALYEKYASRGLVVIGVALDREGAQVVEPFVKKNGVNYLVALGDMDTAGAFGGISSIPATFIIDREGRLVRKLTGYHSQRELAGQVKKYL